MSDIPEYRRYFRKSRQRFDLFWSSWQDVVKTRHLWGTFCPLHFKNFGLIFKVGIRVDFTQIAQGWRSEALNLLKRFLHRINCLWLNSFDICKKIMLLGISKGDFETIQKILRLISFIICIIMLFLVLLEKGEKNRNGKLFDNHLCNSVQKREFLRYIGENRGYCRTLRKHLDWYADQSKEIQVASHLCEDL